MIIGALEAGGTKMVCALGNENGTILEQVYPHHHAGGDGGADRALF